MVSLLAKYGNMVTIDTLKEYGGLYLLGIIIRICIITSVFQKTIADRVEVSTPLNSWKRIIEALYLKDLDIYPYTGDLLHELPLNLKLWDILYFFCKDYIYLIFIVCDAATAYLLYLFAKKHLSDMMNRENRGKEFYADNMKSVLINEKDCLVVPKYVAAAYLFNPYTICNCVGLTSTVFVNFSLAIFLNGLVNKSLVISTLFLANCISQNLYFILLLSPMILQFLLIENQTKKAFHSLILVVIFWCVSVYLSYSIYKSWDFLSSTYGFTLTAPDLRPNIGLFWYFFTEVFEQFKELFLYSFQINILLVYLVPLSIRLRNETMLLTLCLLLLIAVFKPYPCIGDVGFVLSILPCWKYLFPYTQQGFTVAGTFCVATALAPTFWYLWLYSGSANANFYFGVTLAFGSAQVFLLTDILFAYIKREFDLVHGMGIILEETFGSFRLQ
ncbi:hypothetical protein ILUMI_14373 [Ignelater luminosus]|uniref:Phosphatidylinositol glycan anchor biosynthesis class U protein n=1 Tax=Ignelater luminosus TaxID=2038154 RepID=A0A8K0CQL2_IGNLU|nr:hypothetical protein ILUMI_14373 [Ignelater luminosus]